MKDEYVVINKTALDKRIEELKFFIKIGKDTNPELIKACELRIDEINQIRSTPLTPIIEDAFRAGSKYGGEGQNYFAGDYIEDLKIAL
jgi:hypothetical protein